ncbi:MAG TPA: hypothetical protein VFF76_11515 [Holophagaceae bacterium]|jgi:hypothetical protein|nr:hypothetical protein [Holophagaceae bacterium]
MLRIRCSGFILVSLTLVGAPPTPPKGSEAHPKAPIPVEYIDDGDGNMLKAVTLGTLHAPIQGVPQDAPLKLGTLEFWFLGHQWEAEKNDALKGDLQGALAREIAFAPDFGLLRPSNPEGMGFPFRTGTLANPERAAQEILESEIQTALISEVAGEGPLDPSVLHVVFLPPRLVCKLGMSRSGRDFISFLSHVATERGELHYLVVTCGGGRQEIKKAAVRGIMIYGVD